MIQLVMGHVLQTYGKYSTLQLHRNAMQRS